MAFLRIYALGLAAVLAYAVVHDQITVRLSPEYFTIGHPALFETDQPARIALGWGVVTGALLGLPAGFLLASAARSGKRRPVDVRRVVRPLGLLVALTAGAATISGATGYALADAGRISLDPPFASFVEPERHARYLAARWAHGASYAVGLVGIGILIVSIRVLRPAPRRGNP